MFLWRCSSDGTSSCAPDADSRRSSCDRVDVAAASHGPRSPRRIQADVWNPLRQLRRRATVRRRQTPLYHRLSWSVTHILMLFISYIYLEQHNNDDWTAPIEIFRQRKPVRRCKQKGLLIASILWFCSAMLIIFCKPVIGNGMFVVFNKQLIDWCVASSFIP